MIYTIKDVANKSGVSIGTVSKVLNNYPNVSDNTRKKVMDAVKELNYIPNITAAKLSSKKRNRIALYINTGNNMQWIDEMIMQYILGAFDCARNDGLEIITIFYQKDSSQSYEEISSYFSSIGVNGIIVYGITKEDDNLIRLIESGQFKICVIDAPFVSEHVSSVMINHAEGQYDVGRKLLSDGNYHKVFYLAGRPNGFVTDMRIEGIMKLRDEMGFELDMTYADFSERQAYNTTLEKGRNYDAIICASDMMAIGVIKALTEMNIFRPCSGVDGISLLGYVAEGVYTCRQDFYTISYEAIKEMESLLNDNHGKSITIGYEICTISHDDIMA